MQQGEAAAAALNVFLPCTYTGAVQLDGLPTEQRAFVLSQVG